MPQPIINITAKQQQATKKLARARRFYTERILQNALSEIEQVWEKTTLEELGGLAFDFYLLLSEIYSTKAHYLHSESFFNQAEEYFGLAQKTEPSPQQLSRYFFARMTYFLYRENYPAAEEMGKQVLHIFEEREENAGTVQALAQLCQVYLAMNAIDEASTVIYHAETLLQQLPEADEELTAMVYHQLSQLLVKKQEYSSVLPYSKDLLAFSLKNKDVEKELTALNNLAVYFGVLSDYKQAMQYLLEALEKSTAIAYRQFIAQCNINIGTIYAHLFNYEDALERYETVIRDYEDVLGKARLAIIYNNAGNIYYSTERAEIALTYFHKAMEVAEGESRKDLMAISLAQLGRTYAELDDMENARIFAFKAKTVFEETGQINGVQINLNSLANIYFKNEESGKAIAMANQGIEAAKKLKDNISELRGYQLLSNIYKTQQDYKKALEYQEVFAAAQSRFNKTRSTLRILDLEIKYAIKEKQKEIQLLTKENQYQALLLQQSDQIALQNEKLKQVIEELKQFTYVASHDLKEPLRMIASYSQLLHRSFKDQLDEDTEMYFEFVLEGAGRMNTLLDDLLRYATIGKNESAFTTVRLNDMVELATINLRLRIKETETKVVYNNLPEVRGVSSLLIQLFQNLISNAIKFKNEDVIPEIKIDAIIKADCWEISVQDNGIGISPEFKDRIFVIFQRLHPRAAYKGTGIGLAICQKIVHNLGGKIWVESESGKGACFKFTLPKAVEK